MYGIVGIVGIVGGWVGAGWQCSEGTFSESERDESETEVRSKFEVRSSKFVASLLRLDFVCVGDSTLSVDVRRR